MELRCAQCGARLDVAADIRVLACPYCDTALAVDAEGLVFREVLEPTVQPRAVADHLRRFLSGPATVAGLDREARIGEPELELFPFWAFTVRGPDGERTVLMPAAPSSLQGLQGLKLPGAARRPAAAALPEGARVTEPEVPLATARQWLDEREGRPEIRRVALFHVPLYRVDYSWRGRTYRAAVEAVSGEVLPADYPAKSEAPYVLVAGLALAVFGLEGLLFSNLAAKAAVYLLSTPPLLLTAWLVSRRV